MPASSRISALVQTLLKDAHADLEFGLDGRAQSPHHAERAQYDAHRRTRARTSRKCVQRRIHEEPKKYAQQRESDQLQPESEARAKETVRPSMLPGDSTLEDVTRACPRTLMQGANEG